MEDKFIVGTQAYALEQVRKERNRLLAESDWTQFNDSPLTDEQKLSWQIYRQELRNVTQDLVVSLNEKGYPELSLFEWPVKPE